MPADTIPANAKSEARMADAFVLAMRFIFPPVFALRRVGRRGCPRPVFANQSMLVEIACRSALFDWRHCRASFHEAERGADDRAGWGRSHLHPHPATEPHRRCQNCPPPEGMMAAPEASTDTATRVSAGWGRATSRSMTKISDGTPSRASSYSMWLPR